MYYFRTRSAQHNSRSDKCDICRPVHIGHVPIHKNLDELHPREYIVHGAKRPQLNAKKLTLLYLLCISLKAILRVWRLQVNVPQVFVPYRIQTTSKYPTSKYLTSKCLSCQIFAKSKCPTSKCLKQHKKSATSKCLTSKCPKWRVQVNVSQVNVPYGSYK